MKITLTQSQKKQAYTGVYEYFKNANLENANLENASLNEIAKKMFKDGKYSYFFWLVDKFNLEQYLDEYKDILIEYMNIKDKKNGSTPYHYACYYGHIDIIKLFLENGAQYIRDNRDMTPSHYACYYGKKKLYEIQF